MNSLKVNMIDEARNAQWSADTFLGPGSIKAVAPAKINLFLGVIPQRRADGFHEVVNVMHSLALHDTLYFNSSSDVAFEDKELPQHMAIAGPNDNLLVSITIADKTAGTNSSGAELSTESLQIPAADNLVFAAIDQLAHTIGFTEKERISVHIEKCIPHQAGLGGGSADAAAALASMAQLWNLPTDHSALASVAGTLGSDVPFFLHGGCALCKGRGEKVERLFEPSKAPIVLVKPAGGVSTAEAYKAFEESTASLPDGPLEEIGSAQIAADIPLFNSLASTAESLKPELAKIRTWLFDQLHQNNSEPNILLCGSGSATFAIAPDFSTASRIATAAQSCGWWARATTLSRLRATVMPS